MKGLLTATISIFMVITFLLPGCTPAQEPVFGYNPVLSISELPDLGKPVTLTLTFTTVALKGYDSDRLSYCARFLLPPGFYNVLEGSKEVIGTMGAPGQTKSEQITVESIKIGDASIDAAVLYGLDGKFGGGESANTIHITITNDGASFYGGIPPSSKPGKTGYPRLDTLLNRLVEAEKRGEVEEFMEEDGNYILLVDGSVEVMVTPQPGQQEEAISAIEEFAGDVYSIWETSSQLISATVPISNLTALADDNSIRLIDTPEPVSLQ